MDGKVASLDGIGAFVSDFSNIKLLKRASKPYAGDEKYGVSKIIEGHPNVIDAEVAFTDLGNSAEHDDAPPEETVDAKSRHSPRIDFVAVQEDGKRLKLVFFEAKYFTNHELKSGGEPRVFKQIAKYEKLLKKNDKDVADAKRMRRGFYRPHENLAHPRDRRGGRNKHQHGAANSPWGQVRFSLFRHIGAHEERGMGHQREYEVQ